MIVQIFKFTGRDDWWMRLMTMQTDVAQLLSVEGENIANFVITRRTFVEVVNQTAGFWPSVFLPEECGQAADFFNEVGFIIASDSDRLFDEPTVNIVFSRRASFLQEGEKMLDLKIPLSAFVTAATEEFRRRPYLEMNRFSPDDQKNIQKKWQAMIEVLKERAAPP